MVSDLTNDEEAATSESTDVQPFTLWLIWGTLLFAMAMYGVMTQFIGSNDPMPASSLQTFIIALSVVSVSEVPVIWFLRQTMFYKRLDDRNFSNIDDLQQAYFTTSIITWALCESIAIYGFVLAVMSSQVVYYFPFALAGAILMLLFRPNLRQAVDSYRSTSSSPTPDSTTSATDPGSTAQ